MVSDGTATRLAPEEAAAEALRLAEDVLARALRVGATEAEVLVTSDDSALTRFANSEIHQNVAESSRTVNLRFVAGKRIAVMSSGRTDVEGIRSLVNRASAVVRTCEELEDWAGLPKPVDDARVPQVAAWSDVTAGAT